MALRVCKQLVDSHFKISGWGEGGLLSQCMVVVTCRLSLLVSAHRQIVASYWLTYFIRHRDLNCHGRVARSPRVRRYRSQVSSPPWPLRPINFDIQQHIPFPGGLNCQGRMKEFEEVIPPICCLLHSQLSPEFGDSKACP